MNFWNLADLKLAAFRPGISSQAHIGSNLIMAFMEIGPQREDSGHDHPFDQCGIVVRGRIEMFVEADRRILRANETYFIPAGARHGWKTFDQPARLLDISAKT